MLRMLCDLPRRSGTLCVAVSADPESDDRMFDGLQACIIVIAGLLRVGSRSGRDTGCEWTRTRGWWFLQRSRRRRGRRSVLLRHPPAHKMSANAA